jgi:hypothetical protein
MHFVPNEIASNATYAFSLKQLLTLSGSKVMQKGRRQNIERRIMKAKKIYWQFLLPSAINILPLSVFSRLSFQ